MSTINNAIKKLEEEKKKLLKTRDEQRASKTILCNSCSKYHRIKDLVCIQTHWYTPPSGCTGGDYWNEGELQFICPTKNVRNRILFFSEYRIDYGKRGKIPDKFKYMYKHLFKSVEDLHERNGLEDPRTWTNNEYVDKHRKKFEL